MWKRWTGILAAVVIVLTAVVAYWYATKPRIDYARVYKIGFGDDRPLHFPDEDGKPSGLAVGIVREAARRKGIQLAWVRSSSPGITAAQTGEVDLWVMAADLPERHKIAYVTEPYLVTEYCLLAPAETSYRKATDLARARVSYPGYSAERLLVPPLFPNARLTTWGTPRASFDAMMRGDSDAAFLDQYAAGYLALSGGVVKKMRIIPVSGPKYYLSMIANFKVQNVAEEIRSEIRVMAREGSLSPLFEGWGFFPGLNLEAMSSLSRAHRRVRFLMAGVSALALLLAYSLMLVIRLRRQRLLIECALAERNRVESENAKLQARLHQANKMESVGRLAGGIAHDFNNLLTVINGYSELLLGQANPNDPLRAMVEAIHTAGERATGLTRQLLALSRKQTFRPRPMDLKVVVKDIQGVLDRLIGEDIEVVTKLEPDLGQLIADPDQIHQVLMNLVVNARDAMPDGGTLTIEATNVTVDEATASRHHDAAPGCFVLLKVSDSGIGMDQETREHAFEPFFTTKESGKGTGLGLSTVYGIVTQSGGWIEIRSEVGKGTSLSLYLPRTDAGPAQEVVSAPSGKHHGGETVLVVEDQDFVRGFARRVLESYGYQVLEASGSDEACALAEHHPGEIHLLLTDVILRGMNGKRLSELLLLARPNLRVLFMSGYPADVISRRGMLEPGITYIQKPFTPDAMAAKVREVLSTRP